MDRVAGEGFDVLRRIARNAALRKLERPQTEAAPQQESTRGLRITVVIVAMLAALSLGVGLYSILM